MQARVLEFIAALRAAGVRVSLAESLDALHAITAAGIGERAQFRAALQAALVKQHSDRAVFQRLFPAYFGAGEALLRPLADDAALSPAVRAAMHQALQELLDQTTPSTLALLFEAAVTGQPLASDQLAGLLAEAARAGVTSLYFQPWLTRRVLHAIQFDQLTQLLHDLLERLRATGVDADALADLERAVRANQAVLAEQISQAVTRDLLRRASGTQPATRPVDELLDRPFDLLGNAEIEELRTVVARLVARLRTQASLRRRRAHRGSLDPRATMRASMRFGGIPFALRRRRRHRKPRLLILCDLSRSMRTVAGFMLLLVYALHDQLGHTRSFAYIDELYDISADFVDANPTRAVTTILARIRADYARTDLGFCLEQFARLQLGNVDQRTTVLVLGDARNNRSDPGVAYLQRIRQRARRLIWFTPEPQRAWGTGDSDMLAYAPRCTTVHVVRTLRELGDAVERLLDE